MTTDEVVENLIRLPSDFERLGTESAVSLVEKSGFLELPEALVSERLITLLRENPSVVETWLIWSENKRTDEGWVLRENEELFEVFHFSAIGASPVPGVPCGWRGGTYVVSEKQVFNDRFEACAEYIKREIRSIALHVKKPN